MEVLSPVGALTPCPGCRRQPLLVEQRGRELFRMECPPCRIRLWDVPSRQEAIACWEGLPRPTDSEARPIAA